jgi:hypothetical protein
MSKKQPTPGDPPASDDDLDKRISKAIRPYLYFASGVSFFIVVAVTWGLIDKKGLVTQVHNGIFHADEALIKSIAESSFQKKSWITAYQERIVLTAGEGDDGKYESVEVPFHSKLGQDVEIYLQEAKNVFGNRKYQLLVDDQPFAIDPDSHFFITNKLDYESHADIHKLKFSLIRTDEETIEHYRDGRLQVIYCVILVHGKPTLQ